MKAAQEHIFSSPFKPTQQKPRYLPGDMPYEKEIAAMLRVNQAGEYGAKRIYQGQLDMLKDSGKQDILKHMAEQEQVHLDYFDNAIIMQHSRPSALSPLWHAAGYALGALPALLGVRSAMAVTVAVEEVIDQHYQDQLDRLETMAGTDELKKTIKQFQAEEEEHRDTGLFHEAEQAPAYKLLYGFVSAISRCSIFIAQRV